MNDKILPTISLINSGVFIEDACRLTAATGEYEKLYDYIISIGVISKEEAQDRGLTEYYTHQPCKHKHFVKRLVSTGECISCIKRRNRIKYYTRVNIEVHNKDVKTLKSFAKLLNMMRKLT